MLQQEQDYPVLLVEDDAGIAELIREKLGENGIQIAHTRTAREAKVWLESNRPQLVLLDFSLPDGYADELISQVKDMPPFIIVTGMRDERVAVRMMKQGAIDYLLKDADFIESLPQVVKQTLNHISTQQQLLEAQKELKEKESLYRVVIATAMDGFWMVDATALQILEVNDAYCQMSGYSREELLQMKIAQLELNESVNDVEVHLRKILSQSGDRFETRHKRKNGSILHLEVSVQPMVEIGRTFAFLHDITMRKQHEEVMAFLAQCGMERGEDFFQSLARYLGRVLHADYVCIDRLAGDYLSAQTVAIYFDGKFETNVQYTLRDTPCGWVVGKTICTFREGVRHLFPSDLVLQEMLAESYVGATLWGYNGQPIGLIAAIGRKPLDDPQLAEMVLNLVSTRAAGELERRQAEEAMKAALIETSYRQLEIETLLVATNAILEQDNFKITVRIIYDCCKGLVGATTGFVVLLKPENQGNETIFFDPDGHTCTFDPGLLLPAQVLSGDSYRTGQAIFDNDFIRSNWGRLIPNGHIRLESLLFSPLVVAGTVRGMLGLANKPGGFDENDARLATAFGELASIALRNSWISNQLRDSEARFRGYFEQGLIGMAITSPEKGWLAVNQTICDLFGYSQEELISMTWAELTHPEDLDADAAQFNRVMAGEIDGYRMEKRFIRKDQQVIYVDLGVRCKRKSNGDVDYILALLSNITERRRVEDALRETNEYLDNLFNYANAPIIVWDPHYKITRFNHAFESLTGKSAKDVLGKPLKVLFPPSQIKDSMEYIRKTRTGERWEVVEIPIQHVDGSVRIVLWNSATLFSSDGRTSIATIAQGQDITQRKQAEDQIRAALTEKEMLLRELNHRTKNNLNIVNSLIQLQAGMSANAEFSALATTLETRIQSISLVHQMLYKSPSLAQVNLAEYTRELAVQLMSGLSISPQKVSVEVDAAPVFVNIDVAIPYGQILNELISNALKYAFPADRNGHVLVQLAQAQDGEVNLRVSDDGVGFSPDVEQSVSDSLGMIIMQTLVSQLNGNMKLDSTNGVICEIHFNPGTRS